MSHIVSNGTGGGNFNVGSTWVGGTAPGLLDTWQVVSGDTVTLIQAEACGGGTIDNGGTLDESTYDFTNSGLVTVNGTLIGADSSSLGLLFNGFTVGSTATLNMSLLFKLQSNGTGAISIDSSCTFTNNNRGYIIFAHSLTFTNSSSSHVWNKAKIDTSITVTCSGSVVYFTNYASESFECLGTIDGGNQTIMTGCKVGGSYTIGDDADITNVDVFTTYIRDSHASPSTTVSMSSTAVMSMTGLLYSPRSGVSSQDHLILTGHWDNATVQIGSNTSLDRRWRTIAGTLTAKAFKTSNTSSGNMEIDTETNDTSFNIAELFDLRPAGSGAGLRTWLWKESGGSSKIVLSGTTGTHDINTDGQDTQPMEVDCGSATKQLIGASKAANIKIIEGTFDIQTFAWESTVGVTEIQDGGALVQGAASTLTTVGINWLQGASYTPNATSVVYNSGNIFIHKSTIFTAELGLYYHTGDGVVENEDWHNRFRKVWINVGKTFKPAVGKVCYTSASYSDAEFHLLGTIDLTADGVGATRLECRAGINGVFEFGASCDIIGDSDDGFYPKLPDGMASEDIIFTKSVFPNFTGTVRIYFVSGTDYLIPSLDFSNGSLEYKGRNTNDCTLVGMAGTLKVKNLYYYNTNTVTHYIDMAANNQNIEIEEEIDLRFSYTNDYPIWLPGTGSETFKGSSTHKFDVVDCNMCNLIFNCSGIYEIYSDFGAKSFSGTGGTVRSSVVDTLRIITMDNQGQCSNMTLKDLGGGEADMVDCKNNCVNDNGSNDEAFVFEDELVAA